MGDQHAQFDGSIPDHYDRYLGPPLFEPLALDLAGRIEIKPNSGVLELACGTGILTRSLRERLPASTQLTATDLNEPMLAYAKRKLADEAVIWEVADASALPFAPESFDAVVCQFGLMFVPDKAAAFSEVRRVLRPRGMFLFSVWDRIDTNQLGRIAHETVARIFPSSPPDFYKVPFSLCEQDVLESMLRDAGFGALEFVTVSRVGVSPSSRDAALGLVYGNPIITAIRERGPVEVDAVVNAIDEAVARECGSAPVRAAMQAVVITARLSAGVDPSRRS